MASKQIVFIRHAQSEAQAYGEAHGSRSRSDAAHLVDCALSIEGRRAIENLRTPLDHIQLVVVSPMTRALQTACIAFQDHQIPMISHPALAEFAAVKRMRGVENVGRPLAQLKVEPGLTSLSRFASIDFKIVQEIERTHPTPWWELDDERINQNMEIVKQWLADRPETCIAVVGHCNSSMRLLNTKFLIPNAQCVDATLTKKGNSWVMARQDNPIAGHVAYVTRRHSVRAGQALQRIGGGGKGISQKTLVVAEDLEESQEEEEGLLNGVGDGQRRPVSPHNETSDGRTRDGQQLTQPMDTGEQKNSNAKNKKNKKKNGEKKKKKKKRRKKPPGSSLSLSLFCCATDMVDPLEPMEGENDVIDIRPQPRPQRVNDPDQIAPSSAGPPLPIQEGQERSASHRNAW